MLRSNIHRNPEYDQISLEFLLDVFAKGPQRLVRSISGLTPVQMKNRVIPEKWSIWEILIHICDSELMGSARFRQILAESSPTFAGYDQDVWQQELDYLTYSEEFLIQNIRMFESLRSTTLQLFPPSDDKAWYTLRGLHPERGEMTLRDLLELYADHGERHLDQIEELKRMMGLARDENFELLLKPRLY